MRDIKFRAWDPVIKSMHYSGEWHQIIYGGASDDIGIDIKLHYSIKNWNRWGDGSVQRSIDELTWMQYTGLKDKTGKEIYEGDIINTSYGNSKVYIDTQTSRWMYEFDLDCDELWYATLGEGCEIIGNLYEHPELLEKP